MAVGPAWGVDWTGTYAYEGSFGRTAGGTGVVALYEIRIGAKPVTDCRITIDGFQTDETLLCAAHEEAATLTLRFRSDCRGRFALALARRRAVPINSAVTLACYLLLFIEVMADMREPCFPDPCKLLADRRHKAKGCFRSDRLIKGLVAHIDQENRIAVTILAGSNVNSGVAVVCQPVSEHFLDRLSNLRVNLRVFSFFGHGRLIADQQRKRHRSAFASLFQASCRSAHRVRF